MNVSVMPACELGPDLVEIWSDLQRSEPSLQSPFFRPEFTKAIARVRSDVYVGVIEEKGVVGFLPFQRDRMRRARPVGGALCDYQGIICRSGFGCDGGELIRACGLSSWTFDHLVISQARFFPGPVRIARSPVVDLTGGFAAYSEQARARGSQLIQQVEMKRRRLARDHEPPRLVIETMDKDALNTLFRWKSGQCRLTGTVDIFGRPWTVALINLLQEEKALEFSGLLSVLLCGDRMVAAHFGVRSGDVLHWWFPSYDRAFGRYSPGMILLVGLLSELPSRGVMLLDLGKGGEHYKSRVGNGERIVAEGSVEATPVLATIRRLKQRVRHWIEHRTLPHALGLTGLARRLEGWQRYR